MTNEITSNQRKQLRNLGISGVEDAVEELNNNLEKDNIQDYVIEKGDVFKSYVKDFVTKTILEMATPNTYANQEVKSNYSYLSGYKGAHSIDDQISILKNYNWGKEINWKLNDKQKTLLKKSPNGSEGWFIVPFDKTMITDHDAEKEEVVDYGKQLEMVLDFLKQSRNGKLINWREGKLGSKYYRRSKRLTKAVRKLWETQGCPEDVILVSAQFGIKHAGRSVNRASVVIFGMEYPIGSYETCVMLLTHSERLLDFNDLWIDCPGDEYAPDGDGDFSKSPCLYFSDVKLGFGTRDVSDARGFYGSVSGFLPQ
jgi:hypothetical protein